MRWFLREVWWALTHPIEFLFLVVVAIWIADYFEREDRVAARRRVKVRSR